ncbi:ThiF family adenylyltransferase [Fundidesulfovibrio terrae]|uniref:ThiF family adenylyltransferase n=1 Tax=Fundidesulfovibrio terrae TaxID=2922866 RepID=UPI001FAFBB5E|nr:ThiF family adenylyltransferase [Fundidesulfovibrio terrae]
MPQDTPPFDHDSPSLEARRFADLAFARNLGILTPGEQEALRRARIAIPGLGGVGGMHCAALARLGVGAFNLADPDSFEAVNFNRQFGATMRHLGHPKLAAMIEEARQINPHLDIRSFPQGVTPANLDEFLDGVSVVVDGLDFFAFDVRRALFNRARERGIPVVTAAPLGFTSSVLVFTPQSMSFDDYFDIREGLSERERLLRFAVGLAPGGLHLGQIDASRVSLDAGRGPSLVTACLLCAALAATEAVRLVLGRPGGAVVPHSLQFDPLSGRCRRPRPRKGNASLSQRAKLWFVRNVILDREPPHLRPVPPEPAPAGDTAAIPREHLLWLAQAAAQAPSGDNCQPWRFGIESGRLQVHLNPQEDQSFFNFRQMASLVACGAAVQNVLTAAPGIGWAARESLLPDAGREDLLADIDFSRVPAAPDPLADSVWLRCTNRRPCAARREVDPFSQESLREAAAPAHLFFVQHQRPMRGLARLVYLADRIRVERRDLHEHFMGMTRFDPPDGGDSPDGLPLKNLYAGAAGESFLRLTRPWNHMRAANVLGIGRLVALHSKQSIAKSPLAGLVCVESTAREDIVRGGMALERVWLTATRLGLAIQPMTAITLFWLRWKLDGPDAFSRQHQGLLKQVWPDFEACFPGLGEKYWPMLLFRAGYARPVGYGTPRRAVDAALIR